MPEARYIYSIIQADSEDEEKDLGTGVEEEPLHILTEEGVGAIYHECEPEPYESQNEEKAKEWVKQHQQSVTRSRLKFDSILPMTFDTIFKTESKLRDFLKQNKEEIEEKINELRGKREYGVKIYCDESKLTGETGPEEKESEEKASGAQYFEKKKKEKQEKKKKEEEIKEMAKDYWKKIKKHVSKLKQAKAKESKLGEEEPGIKILSVSCLARDKELDEVKEVLEEINEEEGVKVKFTGPWPPYSFVGELGD